jgi:hypothetical protein
MKRQKLFAVSVLLAVTVATSAARGALVSQWKLDDGSGTTATDSVDSNNALFAGGSHSPTWSSDRKIGTWSISVDNSQDQYASAPDSPSLNPTTAITVSAWFKRGDINRIQMFLGKGTGSSSLNTSYWFELDGNNYPFFYVGQATGGDHNLIGNGTPAITDYGVAGVWHHLVGTYDGTTQKIYVDGKLSNQSAWSGTITVDHTTPFSLGKFGSYGGLNFKGLIDDVGLWSTALNDGEAIALFNLGNNATFGYDLGVANQLFAVYEAHAGTVYLGGYRWEYKTGLTGTLGVLTPDGLGNYLLKLDGGTGTGAGLMASVPEPASISLLGLGALGLLLAARRKKRR